MVTMPSGRFRVAVDGHTSMHGGSSQCMQPTGTKTRFTAGYSPTSMSSTRRHWTCGGVALACLHEAAQVRYHGPAGHFSPPARFRLTRTMSAPEPVASVSSIDIGTSEFMLGTPKSLANGVTQ